MFMMMDLKRKCKCEFFNVSNSKNIFKIDLFLLCLLKLLFLFFDTPSCCQHVDLRDNSCMVFVEKIEFSVEKLFSKRSLSTGIATRTAAR